jgi:hypothetical protein
MRKVEITRLRILLILFFSCQNQMSQSNNVESDSVTKNKSNLFKVSSIDSSGFIRTMTKKVGLDNLEKGYNEVQIRFWLIYDFSDTSQIVILKKRENLWYAEKYTYLIKSKKSKSDTTVITHSVVLPKSRGEYLLKKFSELKLEELPDFADLTKGNYDLAHGDLVTVEYAKTQGYRVFSYIDPGAFRDKWWQAENMEKILLLLEVEFGIKKFRSSK